MRPHDNPIDSGELGRVGATNRQFNLSKQASRLKRSASFEREGWRRTHVVDEEMLTAFKVAAIQAAEQNYLLHSGSFKLNVMLTANIGQIARRNGELPELTRRRLMKALQNRYRQRKHRFAGFWRFEVFGNSPDGEHLHIVFHAPRGMREILFRALPEWTNDGLGTQRTSRNFRSPNWRACSLLGTWHLRRVYRIEGILDYLAKLPTGTDNRPLARAERLNFPNRRVREYGTFGLIPPAS